MIPQMLKNALILVANFTAYVSNAAFNVAKKTSCSSDVVNRNIPTDNSYGVPYCLPYGYTSIPLDGTQCVVSQLAMGVKSPIVMGAVTQCPVPNLTLDKGEGAVWTATFALAWKNSGFQYFYNQTMQATPASGEDVQTILNDILLQLEAIYNTELPAIWTQLNNHLHVIGSSSTETMTESGTTITAAAINPNITTDQSFVAAGKILINTSGVTPVRP